MSNKSQKLLRSEMNKVLANMDERWLSTASKRLFVTLTDLVEKEILNNFDFTACFLWNPSYYQGRFSGLPNLLDQLEDDCRFLNKPVFIASASEEDEKSKTILAEVKSYDPESNSCELKSEYTPTERDKFLILIPGLAFDKLGNRLGFGDNVYNIILQKLRGSKFITVGLCWELQLIANMSDSSEDLVVDWLCTESKFFRASTERV